MDQMEERMMGSGEEKSHIEKEKLKITRGLESQVDFQFSRDEKK